MTITDTRTQVAHITTHQVPLGTVFTGEFADTVSVGAKLFFKTHETIFALMDECILAWRGDYPISNYRVVKELAVVK